MPYTHFTLAERKVLYFMLWQRYSQGDVARALGRAPSSISRELRRNTKRGQPYSACSADVRYRAVRRNLAVRTKTGNPTLMQNVNTMLKGGWAPEQIAGRLRLKLGTVTSFSEQRVPHRRPSFAPNHQPTRTPPGRVPQQRPQHATFPHTPRRPTRPACCLRKNGLPTRLLFAHRLIKKTAHSRRYQLTAKGRQICTMILLAQHATIQQLERTAA